jgi:hypothetical protein
MNYADHDALECLKNIKEPKTKVTAGQPKKFTFKEIQDKIVRYFEYCFNSADDEEVETEVLTITGLAAICGFYGRMQLYEYMQYPEFSDLLKAARNIVERGYEKDLRRNSTSGIIFALKQFGWTDTVEQTIKTDNEDPESLKKEIMGLIKSEDLK